MEADRRRGNQTNGAEIVRPSVRPTTSSDAVTCTELAREVRLATEVLMPRPDEFSVILDDEAADRAQLVGREIRGFRKGDRLEPELRERTVSGDVNVSRFVALVADQANPRRRRPRFTAGSAPSAVDRPDHLELAAFGRHRKPEARGVV